MKESCLKMISAEGLKEIDRAIAKYPAEQKQSAVMSALATAQEEHGWLSPELMQFVADYLGMPAVAGLSTLALLKCTSRRLSRRLFAASHKPRGA